MLKRRSSRTLCGLAEAGVHRYNHTGGGKYTCAIITKYFASTHTYDDRELIQFKSETSGYFTMFSGAIFGMGRDNRRTRTEMSAFELQRIDADSTHSIAEPFLVYCCELGYTSLSPLEGQNGVNTSRNV